MSQNDEGSNKWIFMAPTECLIDSMVAKKDVSIKKESQEPSLQIITIRHPCSGEPSKFLYDKRKKSIYEIIAHKDKFASWFMDSDVCQNGALHLVTKFDPLFIILPYLSNGAKAGKFVLLDQILKDDECPDCHMLVECFASGQLDHISDYSGSDQFVGYKYNKEKTLKWLSEKVNITASAVKNAGLFIGKSEDDDYSSSKENEEMDLIKYAFGLISSYIDEVMTEHLRKHLNIRKKAEKRRSSDHRNHLQAKKPKNEMSEEQLKSKKPTKMTKAQRELSKVNKKGIKSISSFFSPTSKK